MRSLSLTVVFCLIPSLVWAGLDAVAPPTDTSQFVKGGDVPALVQQLAPVTKVNGAQGSVTVPYLQRAVGSASASTGTATISFVDPITGQPVTFNNVPSCFEQLSSAQANYVFSKPVVTAKTTTSITYAVSAAMKVINVTVGGLTVWATPPADLTISAFCIAPP